MDKETNTKNIMYSKKNVSANKTNSHNILVRSLKTKLAYTQAEMSAPMPCYALSENSKSINVVLILKKKKDLGKKIFLLHFSSLRSDFLLFIVLLS